MTNHLEAIQPAEKPLNKGDSASPTFNVIDLLKGNSDSKPKPEDTTQSKHEGIHDPNSRSEAGAQKSLDEALAQNIYPKESSVLVAQLKEDPRSEQQIVDQYEKIQNAKTKAVKEEMDKIKKLNHDHGIHMGAPEPLINTHNKNGHLHPSAGFELKNNPLDPGAITVHPWNGKIIQDH